MSVLTRPFRPTPKPDLHLPWWTPGDTNAAFGLGFNVLVNVLVLSSLCIGVLRMSEASVYGVIVPALGIQLLIGNVYYTYLARRLAYREKRDDVTAMPYGPSVPHMFIVTFLIMLPVYLATKDPIKAWQTGLAWAFIIGIIVVIGAFVGPYIRRFTPRAAMLGTLAGISLAFISMRPAAQMWDTAWIALPVFVIILAGFFANVRMPFGLPVGLVALLVGTAIGWAGGFMSAPDVASAARDIAIGLPSLQLDLLVNGLKDILPLLATAIPLGIYNFTEGMSNVESAAAAGDSYNLRSVLLADGAGAIVGSALGSPFPPAVYIGHPGWKAAGGRTGYSLGSGVVIALLCFVGLFGLINTLLPTPAIVPILLYIGLVIGAQAFRAVPKAHYVAVVIAIIPNIAAWAQGLIDNALGAAGTSAAKVGEAALESNSVLYHGLLILGSGAVLAGMMIGAVVAFIVDRNFVWAAGYLVGAAALSFFGIINAQQVELNANAEVTLGYLFAAAVCVAFAMMRLPRREKDADELELDAEEGMVSRPADVAEPEPTGAA
ncbi:AGZA family xanthine/uracil permease-like MFS transporter [Humibacillus xanthopallidus]|uniref:AGZA family xanthine/uracil permease-like MFS transporter n=1 Tax=Humibacillus xanthopallidus TaxID=412689 RepID=A0A543PSE4_9MICO|nr:regulator [Humibacillus xanthopallidus]TQN46966.1 AGZA family xanthine/uracil permease-like MFS transporter [Humibacillus xanthopallidus]